MPARNFKAVIIDLKQVISAPQELLSRVWGIALDEYLDQEKPINLQFKNELKGLFEKSPNEEAILNLLHSKNIVLPEKSLDKKEQLTLSGLVSKSESVFLDIISNEGLNTFSDTINQIKRWKSRGLKIALVSTCKNTRDILKIAQVDNNFDFIYNSPTESEKSGKLSNEAYSYICKNLDTLPEETVLIVNNINSVKTGKEVNFGLVVGMVRQGSKREMLQNGADVVVENMEELKSIGLKKSFNYEFR